MVTPPGRPTAPSRSASVSTLRNNNNNNDNSNNNNEEMDLAKTLNELSILSRPPPISIPKSGQASPHDRPVSKHHAPAGSTSTGARSTAPARQSKATTTSAVAVPARTHSRNPSRASSYSPRTSALNALPAAVERLSLNTLSPRTTPSRSPGTRSLSTGPVSASRSSTPNLLRKASLNSLHSVTPSRAPSRRGSSTNMASSPRSPMNGSLSIPEEQFAAPKVTEASVAGDYFKRELAQIHHKTNAKPTDTVVYLQDSCYGHRYSRTNASQSSLNGVVEKPERLQAAAVGVALAYVRLGERYAEGKAPIHPKLNPQSFQAVPFRIVKSERKLPLTDANVTNVHGTSWIKELKAMCDAAGSALADGKCELQRPGTDRKSLSTGDLYLCKESLASLESALGATCEAIDEVFSPSSITRAFVSVRPPGHHCSAYDPSGFCWVNNVQVGIMYAMTKHDLSAAAILDFDLHHGDGSQAITWDHNRRRQGLKGPNQAKWKKSSIGYFSLHDVNSFPCEDGDYDKVTSASTCLENAHGQTVWNVHYKKWDDEEGFWALYETEYLQILDKMRAFLRREHDRCVKEGRQPKAAIFISAGFDASEYEMSSMQRHAINVPTEFYARITRDLGRMASEEGLGVDNRIISCLEGGYSDRALYSGISSHLTGLTGHDSSRNELIKEEPKSGMGHDVSRRTSFISGHSRHTSSRSITSASSSASERFAKPEKTEFPAGFAYDTNWWSASSLDQLDTVRGPPPPEPRPSKPPAAPSYFSPTQASAAKIVDPVKFRRTGMQSGSPSRPFSPPPPEVSWPVAVTELSKLLIPTDRTVTSLTWEEVKADADRLKSHRQAVATEKNKRETFDSKAPVRKSLRERKTITPFSPEATNRRKTTAGPLPTTTEKVPALPTTTTSNPRGRQPAGRLSLQPTASIPKASAEGSSPITGASTSEGSSRPTTAISEPTASGNVPQANLTTGATRKPRASMPAKREPAKSVATRTRKSIAAKEPVPKPRAKSVTASGRVTKGTSPERQRHSSPPGSRAGSSPRRSPRNPGKASQQIKINLVNNEIRETRRQAEIEKETAAAAAVPIPDPMDLSTPFKSKFAPEITGSASASDAKPDGSLSGSEPVMTPTTGNSPDRPNSAEMQFIPYQTPNAIPAPPVPQTSPIQWMPVNQFGGR